VPPIVIAGGGIAGLEALVALREDLGPDAQIELLEPATAFVERQRSVAEPFGGAAPRRFDLTRIAADHDAHLRPDALDSVDAERRRVRTVRGDEIAYEALLVAVGARPDVAIPGALTFAGARAVGAFSRLLDDLDEGRVERVAFALPTATTWPVPLYELALMTADRARRRVGALVVVTPERGPLEAFGSRIASHVWKLLTERRVAVCTETVPVRTGAGGLLVRGGETVQAERVVALPRLGGPFVGGLPHDKHGFLPTDEHGAVEGVAGVWAAGDGTTFPIKQGGLAAQQADAAATAIAAHCGADVRPEPFRPVLRGMLLDPRGARFLDERRGDMPGTPLWWPPTKVAAPRLTRYLFRSSPPTPPPGDPVDVGQLLLRLAARHQDSGEHDLALSCLDGAEQILGALPPADAERRERLTAGAADA
jgi:sulfide:quinone oxidoreductase